MKKEEFKILLMDDEVDISGKAQLAYQELKEAGYNIEKTNRMSEVFKSFKEEFHHLYILDIDMKKVDDEIEGTGMSVGEILKGYTSMVEILIFSALGTVDDWFKAANRNFSAYIHKKDGVEELLEKIDEIRVNYNPNENFPLRIDKPSQKRALLYQVDNESITSNKLRNILKQEGIEQVDLVNDLAQAVKQSKEIDYTLILLIKETFTNHSTVKKKIKAICDLTPRPQVIIANKGSKSLVNNILSIVNLKPFRFLNLNWSNFIFRLEEAISDALKWYGRKEVFELPETDLVDRLIDANQFKDLADEDSLDDKFDTSVADNDE